MDEVRRAANKGFKASILTFEAWVTTHESEREEFDSSKVLPPSQDPERTSAVILVGEVPNEKAVFYVAPVKDDGTLGDFKPGGEAWGGQMMIWPNTVH